MSTRDMVQKAIADYDREHPPETLYDRRLREKRAAEAAERSDRLVRKALHRESRQAATDNAAAWQAWFHNALVNEFRGSKSGFVSGIAEFVSIYTGKKRDELRREFQDRQRALEARCAALERRLESVAQGRRDKFAFAHTRSEFVLKH